MFPSEYVAYRKDRIRRGGGVFLLIHYSLQILAVYFPDYSFEAVWCKLSLLKGQFLVLGSFYRPFVSSDKSIQFLTSALSSLYFDYLVLGGDFNFPDMQWNEGLPSTSSSSVTYKFFTNFILSFALQQHEWVPTRLDFKKDSTLDLIFGNKMSIITSFSAIPDICDHKAVMLQIQCAKKEVAHNLPRKIFLYDQGTMADDYG